MRNKLFIFLSAAVFILSSCDKKSLFKQPTVEVIGYELKGLPTDSAHLDVQIKLTSNDKRSVHLSDVEYQVEIEGYLSGVEHCVIDSDIKQDSTLEMSLPLTLATDDAIELLSMLEKGQSLDFLVTGTFHVDDPFYNLLDFPIDITGSAKVDVGFEEYFEQPEVDVTSVSGTYEVLTNGYIPTGYKFYLMVNMNVTNKDTKSAEIDEIEYIPTIEGVKAEKGYYSDTYSENLVIAAGETVSLALPVTLQMGTTEGAAFLSKLLDGSASYVVEGTFHTVKVDDEPAEFKLPLYVEGDVSVALVNK